MRAAGTDADRVTKAALSDIARYAKLAAGVCVSAMSDYAPSTPRPYPTYTACTNARVRTTGRYMGHALCTVRNALKTAIYTLCTRFCPRWHGASGISPQKEG